MIDVDAPYTKFHDVNATPEDPSLQRAVDEPIAVPVARPTLASEDSPTPTGRTTEELVAPSPVKQ